jgi:acyl-[acyl-carrier-protein] desaturase
MHTVTDIGEAPDDARVLHDLEPVAADALDDHLRHCGDWHPHEYIPWSQGRTFDGVLDGEPWRPEQARLDPAARDGLVHNLLSEDNLPSYHRVIARMFTLDGAWGTWVNRWTVEEGRHGMAIRDYLLVTRATDPAALERARSAHVQNGYELDQTDVLSSLVYVTLQELGTRVSYTNIQRLSGDPVCVKLLQRIGQDENRHMLFYRTVLTAAMRMYPDDTLSAAARVLASARAPGHQAPGYEKMAASMAWSGIYSPVTHHESVLLPLTRHLGALEATGLGPRGARAQEEIAALLDTSAQRAAKFAALREQLPSSL